MRTRVRGLSAWSFVLVVGLAAVALPAVAGAATKEEKAAAKDHYVKGKTHFDLGEFADAALEFKAAYKLLPEPVFLFNIGQCYKNLGDGKNALFFFKSYLTNAPDAPNKKDVEGLIAELEKGGAGTGPGPSKDDAALVKKDDKVKKDDVVVKKDDTVVKKDDKKKDTVVADTTDTTDAAHTTDTTDSALTDDTSKPDLTPHDDDVDYHPDEDATKGGGGGGGNKTLLFVGIGAGAAVVVAVVIVVVVVAAGGGGAKVPMTTLGNYNFF